VNDQLAVSVLTGRISLHHNYSVKAEGVTAAHYLVLMGQPESMAANWLLVSGEEVEVDAAQLHSKLQKQVVLHLRLGEVGGLEEGLVLAAVAEEQYFVVVR